MTEQELQQGTRPKKRLLAGRLRVRLVAAFILIAAASLFLARYMKPIARANRILAESGIPLIPASRSGLNLEKGKQIYVKFSAEPNTIAEYSRQVLPLQPSIVASGLTHNGDWPSWFRPSASTKMFPYVAHLENGPLYEAGGSDILTAVDAEQNTVYFILPSRKSGLDSILDLFRSMFGPRGTPG